MGFCRTAFALFFLAPAIRANSFLVNDGNLLPRNPIYNVLDHEPARNVDCSNSNPTGPIDTTLCDFETVESVNDELFANLHELVAMPFFKFFQVDLYRECPFWSDDGSCSSPSCAITSVDESQIPERWRAKSLSKLEGSKIEERHELPGCYYRDSDFCFLDDNTDGDYYDLTLIPERYTGYAGPDTARIWRSIYEENCFGLSEVNVISGPTPGISVPDELPDAFKTEDNDEDDGQCLEKRVYYKVISGLHASISTHICQEYLNQTTGEWYPNLQCFINRVASHPERLQYIYFNTVLLLRAISRVGPYLQAFDYCSTGGHEDDAETLAKLSNVISIAQRAGQFDETLLFRGENAVLKEEFKEHFRNVTRIMDCVGCDKCRLWGKIQTTGIATALKILFELDEKALDPETNHNLLQRSEVVALINTLHRFSESLAAVDTFRKMWRATSVEESEQLIVEAERVAKESSRPQPSPRAGHEYDPQEMLLTRWLRVCKESTVECVGMFVQIWLRAVSAVASVFTPSGKEHGPGGYEL